MIEINKATMTYKEVNGIKIDSEEFENKEGKKVNVSIIELTLTKK